MCWYSYLLQYKEFHCPELNADDLHKPSLSEMCIAANTIVVSNGSCEHFCSDSPVNPLTSVDVFLRQNGRQKIFVKLILKVL